MKKYGLINVLMVVSACLVLMFGILAGIQKNEWVNPVYYYVVIVGLAISALIFLRCHYIFSRREYYKNKKR